MVPPVIPRLSTPTSILSFREAPTVATLTLLTFSSKKIVHYNVKSTKNLKNSFHENRPEAILKSTDPSLTKKVYILTIFLTFDQANIVNCSNEADFKNKLKWLESVPKPQNTFRGRIIKRYLGVSWKFYSLCSRNIGKTFGSFEIQMKVKWSFELR